MTLFIRLKDHFRERLHERLTEWEHSVLLISFGTVLAQPLVLLPQLPHENPWGIAILLLGLVTHGSLVVNGMRRRITSWLRAVSAVVGFFVFALISAIFYYAGAIDSAAVLFPSSLYSRSSTAAERCATRGSHHGRSA